MDKDITVTLDDIANAPTTELADVKGWVQEGWKRHLEPGWIPTKLVLSLRTVGRWEQVAKFFPELAPQQPPVEPPHTGGQFIGELSFNGSPCLTQGLSGQPYSYCQFVIPAGLAGKISQVGYAENSTYGGMQFTKTVTFTRTPGDFSNPLRYGSSGYVNVAFEHSPSNAVRVEPGQIWYMNFDNRREDGQPSAGAADNGNFMITPGVPV